MGFPGREPVDREKKRREERGKEREKGKIGKIEDEREER